jgi:hypothetical protein
MEMSKEQNSQEAEFKWMRTLLQVCVSGRLLSLFFSANLLFGDTRGSKDGRHAKVGYQRQVIWGDERCPASMKITMLHGEGGVKIDVIEVEQRQDAGISARTPRASLNVHTLKLGVKQACGKTPCPFVEVSQYDPGSSELAVVQNIRGQQHSGLLTSFEICSPQVYVKDMQQCTARQLQVYANATAPFPAVCADVVVAGGAQGISAEYQVPVSATIQPAGHSHIRPHSHWTGYKSGLIFLRIMAAGTYNLLQRDDVGVDLLQYLHNALGAYPAVHTAALVDIVCGHAYAANPGVHSMKLQNSNSPSAI